MIELSQIWTDIVNYCQNVYENSHKTEVKDEVKKKPNKVVKKKKIPVRK